MQARQGMDWHGKAGIGTARRCRHGTARRVTARQGVAMQAWRGNAGEARQGELRWGTATQERKLWGAAVTRRRGARDETEHTLAQG